MTDGSLSHFISANRSGLASWDGFLPAGAVVMARRSDSLAVTPQIDAENETPAPIPAVSGGSRLRFQFEVPGLGDPVRKALFDKILSALELSPSDYEISAETATGVSAWVTVRFAATVDDQVAVGGFAPAHEGGLLLTTFSLEAMLANPGLKKPVWAHLREALARVRALS